MKITFEKSDTKYVAIDEICDKISHVIFEHPDLLEFVCSLLMSIQEPSNRISKEVVEFFQICKCDVLDSDLSAFGLLNQIFVDYYCLIQDFAFDADLRMCNDAEYKNYKLYENKNKINLFRGIVFEKIISAFVKPRYIDRLYETGSKIIVDGVLVQASYGAGKSKHKKTVDIAAWNEVNKNGEFYECKIRPYNFKQENYEYMKNLLSFVRKGNVQVVTALVTADSQENAESKLLGLCTGGGADTNISCIGKEKLTGLKSFVFSMSA